MFKKIILSVIMAISPVSVFADDNKIHADLTSVDFYTSLPSKNIVNIWGESIKFSKFLYNKKINVFTDFGIKLINRSTSYSINSFNYSRDVFDLGLSYNLSSFTKLTVSSGSEIRTTATPFQNFDYKFTGFTLTTRLF